MRLMMNKKNDKKWIFWFLKDGICFCVWLLFDNDVIIIISLVYSWFFLVLFFEKNKNIIVIFRKLVLCVLIVVIKMDVNEDYFI